MELTQESLRELLLYEPVTGDFYWIGLKGARKDRNGTIAGHKLKAGYITIRVLGKLQYAHRLAFLYMAGYLPENEVDHIDRDRGNNKWENLRHVSRTCNARNSTLQINNTSGIKGVSPSKFGWQAEIQVHGKNVFLGRHQSLLSAAKARRAGEIEYDFPNCDGDSSAAAYIRENETNLREN